MGTEILAKVTEYIDALAASLGVAAAHVYELMARQMVAEGIVYSVLLPVLVVVATIAVVRLAKLTAKNWSEIYGDAESLVTVAWALGGLVYMALVVATVVILPESIMKIFNPEYYVIREILETIKGGA